MRPPSSHEPPGSPFPPSLSTDTLDVELAHPDDQGGHDTLSEGSVYLGSYATLEQYFRALLEPEIQPGVHWILDTVDWSEIRARFESDGSRLCCEHGRVYKVGGR